MLRAQDFLDILSALMVGLKYVVYFLEEIAYHPYMHAYNFARFFLIFDGEPQ